VVAAREARPLQAGRPRALSATFDEGWSPVIAEDALADRRPERRTVDGVDVLVVRDGERLFAIGNRCTHQGAPLSKGRITFSGSIASVTCPVHGSMFDLTTGKVMRAPATVAEPAYDARVNGGMVEIRRRD
jgi:nitrite reductase/ring-hydroxylating ferredoxin subunit